MVNRKDVANVAGGYLLIKMGSDQNGLLHYFAQYRHSARGTCSNSMSYN